MALTYHICCTLFQFTSFGFFSLFHTQNPTQENKSQTGLEHLSRNRLIQWFPQWLVCLVLDTIKTFLNLVYMQAEHTRAKRARKSPVLTSPDMYSSEGKPQIYLLQFSSVVKNIYNYNTSST